MTLWITTTKNQEDKQMTLLELLVKELPKRGGWPEGHTNARQDGDMEICFSGGNDCTHDFRVDYMADDVILNGGTGELSAVTREQYEDAIANNAQPEPENKVTRLDILDAINCAVSIKLDDAFELTETLMDAFDIKHK